MGRAVLEKLNLRDRFNENLFATVRHLARISEQRSAAIRTSHNWQGGQIALFSQANVTCYIVLKAPQECAKGGIKMNTGLGFGWSYGLIFLRLCFVSCQFW